MSKAIWSTFESIVLHEVCASLCEERDDNVATKLYNDLVYYSTSSFCIIPLSSDMVFRNKTLGEITSKVNYTASHTVPSLV